MNDLILEKIDNVINDLKALKAYKDLQNGAKIINNDPQIQAKITAFNKAKDFYNECSQYGKHHPNLKDARKALQSTKIALFEDPIITDYKANEKALQETLNNLSEKLNHAINVTPKGVASCQSESV